MTTPGSGEDVLAAALIQLSGHAERLGALGARETSHHEHLTAAVHDLSAQVTGLSNRITEISAALARQSAAVDSLEGLAAQVAAIATQVAALSVGERGEGGSGGYQPALPPRWWRLAGPERETAVDHLRAWVEQIYRPGYGKLAALLPSCWEQHPACLYILDWLSELWSLLYLCAERDSRILAAQAEWHTRLLPAAADLMATEGRACQHTYRRDQPGAPAAVNGPRPHR